MTHVSRKRLGSPRDSKRLDSLEWRMDAMEKSVKDVLDELKPVSESVKGLAFIAKLVGFLTVTASAVAAVASLLHR